MSAASWGPTPSSARTSRRSLDPALRGRTYAISFERVWNAAVELAGGGPGAGPSAAGLRGWRVVSADDQNGVLTAEVTTPILRRLDDVRVRVGLDANAQTRVDVESKAREGGWMGGRHRRRIRRFIQALDRRLEAAPGQILDGARELTLSGP